MPLFHLSISSLMENQLSLSKEPSNKVPLPFETTPTYCNYSCFHCFSLPCQHLFHLEMKHDNYINWKQFSNQFKEIIIIILIILIIIIMIIIIIMDRQRRKGFKYNDRNLLRNIGIQVLWIL